MKKLKSIFSLNPTSITVCLSILVLVLFSWGVPIFDLVEFKTFDLRFISRGIEKASPEVVLAVLDEKSLDTEGRWPWPRSKMASLIDALSEDGAKVIGFDIGFLEPDENSRLKLVQQLEKKLDEFQVENPRLKKFVQENGLEGLSERAAEDEFIYRNSYALNHTYYAAQFRVG